MDLDESKDRSALSARERQASEERRSYLRILAEKSAARQQSDRPWLTHLAVQLRRAISPDQHSIQRLLATGLQAMAQENLDAAREAFFGCLENFPWQRDGYGRWTDEPDWREKFPQFDARKLPFVQPASGSGLLFEPVTAWNPGDLIIIAGNRAHLAGREWQDPLFLGEKITVYAQRYTRRYLEELSQIFAEVQPKHRPRLIALTCNAIENRHENRLEHFKLYQEPSWTHPRLVPTARAIFQPIFGKQNETGEWIGKTDAEIDAAPAFRALTFSIGGTAGEQLFNEAAQIAQQLGVTPNASARYFQRCLGAYVGGYMSNNIVTDIPARRYLMVSFLDENVVGSPEVDESNLTNTIHFTTPLRLPHDPWAHLTSSDINALAAADFLSCRALPMTSLSTSQVQLGLFAGEVARKAANSPDAETMRLTRFGHRIPPQIDAIRQHYPKFGVELAAQCNS